MAAAQVSRTSSGKTSKKQTPSPVNTDAKSSLTNLMLTAEMLAAPSIKMEAEVQQDSEISPIPEIQMPSLWSAIRSSPKFSNMIMSLSCSFFVSAVFYGAAKTMMKTKFNDMFAEKLPRYNNLVYGIGSVKNIDVDRVLLRDDLNDQYFVQDEKNGSITIDVQKILDQCKTDSKEIVIKHNAKNTLNKFQDDQIDSVRVGLSQSV
jgi:hypothetical protein